MAESFSDGPGAVKPGAVKSAGTRTAVHGDPASGGGGGEDAP